MPALNQADWIPIAEAAQLLGVSARQIQRREQAGNIEKRFGSRVGSAGAPVLYSRADVEALKAGTPNVHAREVTAVDYSQHGSSRVKPDHANGASTALARIAPVMTVEQFRAFASGSPPPAPRPWLTLAEAVEYSGLPRAFLLARAIEGVPWALDVGQGGARAFWRFNREGLKEAR